MQERIIEIIVYVIGELREKKSIGDVDLDELQKRGYTKSEISTAFSWIVDRLEMSGELIDDEQESSPSSFRILNDVERDLFTPEAWGEMVQLNSFGLLSNENVELLIEKAIVLGHERIGTRELKTFVASIVFEYGNGGEAGNRFMLRGNDTIN